MKRILTKIGTLPVLPVMHAKGRLVPHGIVEVRRLGERASIRCIVVEKVESPSGATCHWVMSRI